MPDPPLKVIATSDNGSRTPRFRGEDLFITIALRNQHATGVGVPVEFLQQRGPIIRLIDTRTGRDNSVPNRLGDPALREVFTDIAPGQPVQIRYVITAAELRQFGTPVDVSAEVTILADVRVDGQITRFLGSDVMRIVEGEPAR